MQKFPKYQPILSKLGLEWEVFEELFAGLEEFTCAIYGRPRFKDIDRLRYTLIKEKCYDGDRLRAGLKVDLSTFPPCRGALQQHIGRVNYQVAIWRRADMPVVDVPSPTDGHGWTSHLEPLWVDGPIIPEVLADEVDQLNANDIDDELSDNDSDADAPLNVSSESEDSDDDA
jgi:hypothetical protein